MRGENSKLNISVAIDGPAAAGKSTIASLIAKKFELMYINTGSMYRAITLICMKNNIPYQNVEKVVSIIKNLDMYFNNNRLIINGKDIEDEIRSLDVTNNVSNYAAIREVRDILVSIQKNMAYKYNVVMDGRDIGTVVLKNSPLKFFLTATAEARARRRYNELNKNGILVEYNDILNDILKRDYIDSNRKESPLKRADDSIEIDSSDLSIEEVVNIISNHIKEYIASLCSN
ncbi:(d)CMP kinase [Clostridium tyrobutyricum]|jgi:cytidylate kinase|uniref:(d)CMP kinase n=1 Tax=Clostridium tyrobutyricum TaxID=1519 RepID=UPI00160202FC|nr:(d)CMP kinase [Clostridium tyrobutyricum]MBR9647686.1 (d)CMP kinase [Clostridium tyrobutyricum]MBV4415980.1 (d)CMP kinase [Clostridium tyrobutyricum]MBV4422078.1 (d)CMP kinase [Clostridium tyrobutyricum]MBV4428121.1 (d)CMP kinase [Clostridium tyrobutyricum]MBV4430523.1 (d)CMP kinase [Clostridium tyrobutyricum]